MDYRKRLEQFKQTQAKHAPMLHGVLWKLTGDPDIFAEALQYALLQIWRHVEKLNNEKTANSYIYRIALSANSKAWKNRTGKNSTIVTDHPAAEKSPAQLAHQNETAQLLRYAVTKLSKRQAKAVTLRYLEQKDYETLAKELQCAQAAARSHVSKALANLKKHLAALKPEVA